MCVSLVQISAFATADADTQAAEQITSSWGGGTVSYKSDGTTTTGSDWVVQLTRTLQATGHENLFNVNMQVVTKGQQVQVTNQDAAVVLVLDTSGSMGYCAECGGDEYHLPSCNLYKRNDNAVKADQTRLAAAKAAVASFLDGYSEVTNAGAQRYVSLVTFGKNAAAQQITGSNYWVNVAHAAGAADTDLTSVNTKVSNLSANGGTNTEGGFQLAYNLLKSSQLPAGIANKYVIFLSDGEPTYHLDGTNSTTVMSFTGAKGGGSWASYSDWKDLKSIADNITSSAGGDAAMYSLLYGNTANATLYGQGGVSDTTVSALFHSFNPRPATGNILTPSTSDQLKTIFQNILNQQNTSSSSTNGITSDIGALLNVGAGTARAYSFIGFLNGGSLVMDGANRATAYNGAAVNNGSMTWDLSQAASVANQASNTTTYNLSYQVRLDNALSGFLDWSANSTDPNAEYSLGNANLSFTYTSGGTSASHTAAFPEVKSHGYLAGLSLTKQAFHNNSLLSGAVFQLDSLANADVFQAVGAIHRESSSDQNGAVTFLNGAAKTIPSGYGYTLTEKTAPTGYDVNGDFSANVSVAYGVVTHSMTSTVVKDKLTQTTGDLTVTKTWQKPDGISARPITIQVYRADTASSNPDYAKKLYGTLTANGATVSAKTGGLSDITVQPSVSGNTWTYTLKNLPLNIPETGGTWTYSLGEDSVAGFQSAVSGYTITNTATGTTAVSAVKQWILPEDAATPDVTVQLYRNDETYGSPVTLDSTTSSKQWTDLPLYNGSGQPYTYTVTESYDSAKYEQVSAVQTGNNWVFVNTVKQENISKDITKTWNDGSGESRPSSITVQLKQDESNYGDPVTLTKDSTAGLTVSGNVWTYTFQNLPRYAFTKDANGRVTAVREYVYTVAEAGSIDGYTSSASGLAITNTRSATASVTVDKVWEDSFTNHPNVTVQLMQSGTTGGGTAVQTASIGSSDHTEVTWDDVPVYDGNGQPYTYTVTESGVPGGYSSAVSYGTGNDHIVFTSGTGTATVTNTLQADDTKTTYTINKVWQQPSDVAKPDLTVTLYQKKGDGTATQYGGDSNTYTVPGTTGTLTIADLPLYYYEQAADGSAVEKQYSYYAEEICPSGYTSDGGKAFTEGSGITFTNTITGTTSVQVSKSWLDAAEPSPTHTGAVVTVTRYTLDGNNSRVNDADWSATWNVDGADKSWTDLAKYDGSGNRYFYEAAETTVPAGYTSSGGTNTGTNGNFAFSFVNTLNDNGTSHTAVKTWIDGGTANTSRPDITVDLSQGNSVFASATLKGDGTYTVSSSKGGHDGESYGKNDVTFTRNGNTWTAVFGNLPAYNADRTVKYSYAADEESAPAGYTKGTTSTTDGTSAIFNTLTQDTSASLGFTKTWVDPAGTEHPNVTFKLVATDSDTADTKDYSKTVTLGFSDGATAPTNDGATVTSDTWSYSFNDLPKYTENRYPITYSIQEITDNLSGYDQTDNSANGVYLFTNTLKQAYVSASVTKTWDNRYSGYLPEYQQPEDLSKLSVQVQLYRRVGTNMAEPVGDIVTIQPTSDGNRGYTWSHDFGDQLEKYDASRNVYTYFVREVYQNGDTYTLVDGSSVNTLPVNGREYTAAYTDTPTSNAFATQIANTFVNPQKHYYQVMRTYDTYLSGTLQDSRTEIVTGDVNTEDTAIPISVNAGDYTTYTKGGVTSPAYQFVQGRINQNNGTDTTNGAFQTESAFSQTLTDPNVLYTFDLQYRLDLYKLNVNYVFTSGTKPASGFEDYTDVGEYQSGAAYTAALVDAPAGYECYQATVQDSGDPARVASSASYNTGSFGGHDVTVTYYYRQLTGEDVVVDPTLTIRKEDSATSAAILGSAATFGVYSTAECTGNPVKTLATSTSNGEASVKASELGEGTWYLKETQAPEGYAMSSTVWAAAVGYSASTDLTGGVYVTTKTWTLGVTENGESASALTDGVLVVPNSREYGYLTITKNVTGLQAGESKTFTFTIGGLEYDTPITISATGNGSYALSAPIRVPTGTYAVTEDSTSAFINGYDLTTTYSAPTVTVTTANTESSPASVTVTNAYTYQPESNLTTINGQKTWEDDNNRDGLRPLSVRVQLYDNDVLIPGKTVDVSASGDGSFSFTYDSYLYNGTVTVKETGYTDSTGYHGSQLSDYLVSGPGTSGNHYTITNTHTPETMRIQVNKVWNSGVQQAVTLRLQADGKNIDGAAVTLNGTVDEVELTPWQAEFSGTFYKYENGKPIDYSVTEDSLGSGWSVSIQKEAIVDGDVAYGYSFTATNSYSGGGGGEDSTSYYYRVDYVYTGYGSDGTKIYSDGTTGSVQNTGMNAYSFTAADTADHGGYDFSLAGDPNMSASLTGTSRNAPHVFTVYYEFTELVNNETPLGETPGTGIASTPGQPAGTDISENGVPLSDANVPATGDSLMSYIMAAAVSGLGLVWLALSRKKHDNEENS